MAKQAVLLAAGRGSRLGELTIDRPKCMVSVGGRPLLDRTLTALDDVGVESVVVATGHCRHELESFLAQRDAGPPAETVFCEDFATTNNIVSLWRLADRIDSAFYLVECDLLFDSSILQRLQGRTAAAVSPLREWMDGTVVSVQPGGEVSRMYVGKAARPAGEVFKTVNIYRIGLDDWRRTLWPRLDAAVASGRVDIYYEMIFAEAVAAGELRMAAEVVSSELWREIDDASDLQAAEAWLKQPG